MAYAGTRTSADADTAEGAADVTKSTARRVTRGSLSKRARQSRPLHEPMRSRMTLAGTSHLAALRLPYR